ADKCIQSVYRDLRLQRKSPQEHVGVLGNLILRDAMALGDIRASVTEMMAGGVDTVSAGGRAWGVLVGDKMGRKKVLGTPGGTRKDMGTAGTQAEGRAPCPLSELSPRPAVALSRRLHPVAVTLQRYTATEVILQQYRIPP
ncbi:CP11A protein, partial [Malurus elegans]|nr:CP11A protein [Malurus elegans]